MMHYVHFDSINDGWKIDKINFLDCFLKENNVPTTNLTFNQNSSLGIPLCNFLNFKQTFIFFFCNYNVYIYMQYGGSENPSY